MDKIKIDDSKLKILWEKGLSDVEMAFKLNASDITISAHRRKLGLKSNKKPTNNITVSDEFFIKICNELQSDGLIARYFKTSVQKIKTKRLKLGIIISNYGANPIIELSHKQKEFIFGCLLGDGYCKYGNHGKIASFEFNHSLKQKEYVKYKYSFLENFPGRMYYFKRKPNEKTGEEYETYTASFKTNLSFNEMREMFYLNGKKHIPVEYLKEYYTPLALAIHYMDDGTCTNKETRKTPEVNISTCSFEKEELQILSDFIESEYNIKNSITSANRIRINTCSVNDFMELVKPYICESMKYKLVS